MGNFQLVADFIFGLMHDLASLFSQKLLFILVFGLFVLRFIVGVLYKIKRKGGF